MSLRMIFKFSTPAVSCSFWGVSWDIEKTNSSKKVSINGSSSAFGILLVLSFTRSKISRSFAWGMLVKTLSESMTNKPTPGEVVEIVVLRWPSANLLQCNLVPLL